MTTREVVGRAALVVGSSLVAVGLAEVVLRVLAPAGASPQEYVAFRKSSVPGLDYEFVPGARLPWAGREIRVNRQGFRGPEFSLQPTAHPRIAVIGDSIAAGYGVAEEEAFPYRASSLLREKGLPGEVLDFGVPGYNLDHIIALWTARVAPYRPDLVLYAMCLNDARPELSLTREGILAAAATIELSPERAQPGRIPLPGKSWLREHSLFYQFMMARYDLVLRRLHLRAEPLPPLEAVERLYVGSPEGERFQIGLAHLIRSVRDNGAEFVLVCFPMAEQLRARRAAPQAALRGFAASLEVPFVDLYPAFVAAAGDGEAVLDEDGLHPTRLGHHIAAREVVGALHRANALH